MLWNKSSFEQWISFLSFLQCLLFRYLRKPFKTVHFFLKAFIAFFFRNLKSGGYVTFLRKNSGGTFNFDTDNFFSNLLLFHLVTVQLYSPKRPVVDIAEVFLWLMAVGTILCGSYWSAWSAREAAIEQDKLLKVLHP